MKTVARAIILNEKNEVLLGRRMRGPGEGQWALLGGRLDDGETPEEAVVREVMEEIGVVFRPVFFKDMVTKLPEEDSPWHLFLFLGTIDGIPVQKPDEVGDLRYFNKDEIKNIPLAFNHNEILEEFFLKH